MSEPARSPRLILASASPRRRELLAALVPAFDVVPADIPEPFTGDPVADALRLAETKAAIVAERNPGAVVLGSDTVVHLDGRPFGKPTDDADAVCMWQALRGRTHTVTTAVATAAGSDTRVLASHSRVTLAPLGDDAIRAYVASGRPLDKAGAYAIQDEDVPTVATYDGCYCGIMGLPLWATRRLLLEAGVACSDPGATLPRCRHCPERG